MNFILPLRIAQALFSLLVLGLAGYCVDAIGIYPEAGFLVFTSVWTFIVLAYLLVTPMYYPQMHNRWVVVGSESVTMIFWFAGFIAIADSTRRFICFGAGCRVFDCARAAAAFACFSWLAWAATLALIIHALIEYRKGGHGVDPDAGNATTPNNTTGAGHKEEGTMNRLPASNNDQDIEMHGGGGQKQQPALELNFPEPIHQYTGQHPPLQQQNVYGYPPNDNAPVVAIPAPADFGGRD